jgi:hypothetical protein
MAGMRRKGDGWHCTFRFRGKRFYFAAGNLTEPQAQAKAAEVKKRVEAPKLTRVFILRSLVGLRKQRKRAGATARQ